MALTLTFKAQVEAVLTGMGDKLLKRSISVTPFQPEQDVVLAPLYKYKENANANANLKEPIPSIPGCEAQPCLLLHGLQKAAHKEKNVFKYIDENKHKAVTVLYGTSGAGKTRSILEYLSFNKGVYLVGGRDPRSNAPGSADTEYLCKVLKAIEGENEDERRATSDRNYMKVLEMMRAILYIRHAVYTRVNKELGPSSSESLTPYQWLLLQMYPIHYFDDDIFKEILSICMESIDKHGVPFQLSREFEWEAIVMDESQQLLRRGLSSFCSSKNSKQSRSLYSAVLNALIDIVTEAQEGKSAYPTFSGTGMAMGSLTIESNSAMGKRESLSTVPPFIDFPQLDVKPVEAYLSLFLNLDHVDASLQKHVARWLVGRPRWTATFIEEFLVRKYGRKLVGGTRGSFTTEAEKRIVQALDKYIGDMTASKENRGESWTEGIKTPRAAIDEFMATNPSNNHTLGSPERQLERAIFRVAVGGEATTMDADATELIMLGVARLHVERIQPGNTHYLAIVSEPLVVAAGVEHFGLANMARNALEAQNPDGPGIAFESCCLSPIRNHLTTMLTDFTEMKTFAISKKSSYGVLIRNCGKGPETMDWIKQATSATLEGTVEPFCSPDNNMGPDLLSLLWNNEYTEYRSLIAQTKLEMSTNQKEALQTLVPEKLWIKNRGTDREASTFTATLKVQKCKKAKELIAPTDKPCVRLLVQYPTHCNGGSKFELCHKDGTFPCRDEDCVCSPPYCDLLRTIDGKACKEFFDSHTLPILQGIIKERKEKGKKRKKRQKGKKEGREQANTTQARLMSLGWSTEAAPAEAREEEERLRKRTPEKVSALTQSELRVARLAAQEEARQAQARADAALAAELAAGEDSTEEDSQEEDGKPRAKETTRKRKEAEASEEEEMDDGENEEVEDEEEEEEEEESEAE